jgi:hypothetical protein
MLFDNVVAEPFSGRFNSLSLMIPLSAHRYPQCAVVSRPPVTLKPAVPSRSCRGCLRMSASRSSIHSTARYVARLAAIPFAS